MTARLILESWLEATLAAGVLALFLWLPGRRLLSARWLHLGWSVVLLKLLLPPLVCLPVLPVASVFNVNVELKDTGVVLNENEKGSDFISEEPDSTEILAVIADDAERMEQSGKVTDSADTDSLKLSEVSVAVLSQKFMGRLPEIMVGLWVVGLVYAVVVTSWRFWGLKRFERELKSADGTDEELLAELCFEMGVAPGRVPELKVVALAVSPLVKSWGFAGRPVLILPELLWAGWNESEKKAVLAHELAHLKRGDDRFAWLGLAVRLLQWHNPLAHWAFCQWKEAEEDAADALALATLGGGTQARRDLAGAILQTIEFLRKSQSPGGPVRGPLMQIISTLTSARALKRRVAAIGRFSVRNDQMWNRGGWIMSLILPIVLPLGFVAMPQRIVTVQAAAHAVDEVVQGASEPEITAELLAVEPLGDVAALASRENIGDMSLEERLVVMEKKLILIQDQVRELRQAKTRKMAARKARQAARNSNAISE